MTEKILKKLLLTSYGMLIMVVIIGALLLFGKSVDVQNSLGGQANPVPTDLVGTKIGTSTTAVGFGIAGTGGQSATTTYPYLIGNETDSVSITLQAKNASTTSNLQFSILGSNDTSCNTASTTSSLNAVTTGEINWFDLEDHFNNKVHSTSLEQGTSTLVWSNPIAGTGKELTLNDLNSRCIAFQVSGSSTTLWAQIRYKNFK